MSEKIKRPTKKEYREAEAEIMQIWCPVIYACVHCGWPVVSGYCCTTCGSTSPGSAE